ncbi:3-hydroxyacyl-CoA dehydrogenase family protein [Nocardia miyunensis]|uniref:3-hydroxyacyl-CoA dehydrogenase family protein n=1 Tax=Nocardia miyunensis TaxID=282684 RepID=UPI000832D72D|nr:3-hydroxyacyl-CoA dehydrogenase family protein [Nocardia miyunensis]
MDHGFKRVAVLGMGTMGAGITQVIAQAGYDVTALEADRARADAGVARVRAFLDEGVSRGKVTPEERDTTLARLTMVTDPADLGEADLVIEAVFEDRDVKFALLQSVCEAIGPDAVIVTNTSALSVSDLATAVPATTGFAGLHFFNPAPLMKVIEVVRGLQTADTLVHRLIAFVESLGKTPVVVKDRPGFLVNHLLIPYLNDVIQEYDDELASAEDLDTAIRLGLGHKLGPLELLDLIGLDVHLHATESAYAATHDIRFAAPPLLRSMVAAGRLGSKSGSGFRTDEETAS